MLKVTCGLCSVDPTCGSDIPLDGHRIRLTKGWEIIGGARASGGGFESSESAGSDLGFGLDGRELSEDISIRIPKRTSGGIMTK